MLRPSTRTSPASGTTKPAIVRISVVLPQPEGPSRVTSAPGGTDSVTESIAGVAPKCLTSPSMSSRRPRVPEPAAVMSLTDDLVELVGPGAEALVDRVLVEGDGVAGLRQHARELAAGCDLAIARPHVPDLGDHLLPLRADDPVDELRGEIFFAALQDRHALEDDRGRLRAHHLDLHALVGERFDGRRRRHHDRHLPLRERLSRLRVRA